MILPQKNAKLVAVHRGGTSEDYGDAEGEGASVWSGETDAYFSRRRATLTEGQSLNRTTISYVIVPGDLGIEFEQGDKLTLVRRDAQIVVTVREVPDRDLDFALPQPINLSLEEV